MHNMLSSPLHAGITATSMSPCSPNFKPSHPRLSHFTDSTNSPNPRLCAPCTPPQRKPRSPVCILPHASIYLTPPLTASPGPVQPCSPVASTSFSSPTSPVSAFSLCSVLPSSPASPGRMATRGSHWSFAEKARFEAALLHHGPFAWRAIVCAVATRSEKQVKAYAARYRRRKKLSARAELDALRDNMATAAQARAFVTASPPPPHLKQHHHPPLFPLSPRVVSAQPSRATSAVSSDSGLSSTCTHAHAAKHADTYPAPVPKVEPRSPQQLPWPSRPLSKPEPLIPQLIPTPMHTATPSAAAQPQPYLGGPMLGLGVLPDGGEEGDEGLFGQTHVLVADDLVTSSSTLSLRDGDDVFPTDPFSNMF